MKYLMKEDFAQLPKGVLLQQYKCVGKLVDYPYEFVKVRDEMIHLWVPHLKIESTYTLQSLGVHYNFVLADENRDRPQAEYVEALDYKAVWNLEKGVKVKVINKDLGVIDVGAWQGLCQGEEGKAGRCWIDHPMWGMKYHYLQDIGVIPYDGRGWNTHNRLVLAVGKTLTYKKEMPVRPDSCLNQGDFDGMIPGTKLQHMWDDAPAKEPGVYTYEGFTASGKLCISYDDKDGKKKKRKSSLHFYGLTQNANGLWHQHSWLRIYIPEVPVDPWIKGVWKRRVDNVRVSGEYNKVKGVARIKYTDNVVGHTHIVNVFLHEDLGFNGFLLVKEQETRKTRVLVTRVNVINSVYTMDLDCLRVDVDKIIATYSEPKDVGLRIEVYDTKSKTFKAVHGSGVFAATSDDLNDARRQVWKYYPYLPLVRHKLGRMEYGFLYAWGIDMRVFRGDWLIHRDSKAYYHAFEFLDYPDSHACYVDGWRPMND